MTFRTITPAGEGIIDAIVADPAHALVASDFDGTLAPIVDDPERAGVDPRSLAAFARVGRHVGQVALVTGRDVLTVRRLGGVDEIPGLENLVILGQYGVERWEAVTQTFTNPPPPEAIAQVLDTLPSLLAGLGIEDVTIENKVRAVGVHTRRSADPAATHAALAEPLQRLADRYDLQLDAGRHVWELRSGAADKGRALGTLIDALAATSVVMCGDDLGDLPAFARVAQARDEGLAGACVVASSEEQPVLLESADVLCEGTGGVADWLEGLADALESAR